jgi:hypothetical protein
LEKFLVATPLATENFSPVATQLELEIVSVATLLATRDSHSYNLTYN